MKFGLFIPGHWFDTSKPPQVLYREMVAEAEYAEQLGFDTVWLAEHHFLSYIASPDPIQLAAIIADRTSRINLGFAVMIAPLHHPLRLAGQLAQLDVLSNGRVRVGMGRGASQYELRRLGTARSDAESREFMIEHMQIMQQSWQSMEGREFRGKYFDFDEVTIVPPPTGTGPDLLFAALSHGSISWAVDSAVDLGIAPRVLHAPFRESFDFAAQAYRTFTDKLDERGIARDQGEFVVHRNAFVAPTNQDARSILPALYYQHRSIARMIGDAESVKNGEVIADPVANEPTEDEMIENLLVGDPGRVAEKVNRYAELGVDELSLYMHLGQSHGEVMRSMELFADRVMSQIDQPATGRWSAASSI